MSAAVHEAERAVLGAILLEPDRLPDLRAILADRKSTRLNSSHYS